MLLCHCRVLSVHVQYLCGASAIASHELTMGRESSRCAHPPSHGTHLIETLHSNVWLREIFDKADVNHDEELTIVCTVSLRTIRLIRTQGEVAVMLADMNVHISTKDLLRKFNEVLRLILDVAAVDVTLAGGLVGQGRRRLQKAQFQRICRLLQGLHTCVQCDQTLRCVQRLASRVDIAEIMGQYSRCEPHALQW